MPDAFALGGRISLGRIHAEIIQYAESHGRAPTEIEMTAIEWAVLKDDIAWFLIVPESMPGPPTIFGRPVRIVSDPV